MTLRRPIRIARGVLVAVSVAASLALIAPPSTAVALTSDFVSGNAITQGLYSEMVIHPQGLWHDGVYYFAWQGTDYDPFIVSYDTSSGVWHGPYRAGTNPLKMAADQHGAPAIYVDDSGYVHLFFGCHNTTMRHVRTRRPGDISSWVALAMPAGPYTYPQPMRLPDGRFALFSRGVPGYWADWGYRVATTEGATWSPPRTLLHSNGWQNWYANFRAGSNGRVLMSFVRTDFRLHQSTGDAERYDVYFMSMDASGTCRDADEDTLTTPIAWWSHNATRALVYDSGTQYANWPVASEVGTSPVVLFRLGGNEAEATTAIRWMCARRVDGAWESTQVVRTSNRSANGTLVPGPGTRVTAYLPVDDPDDLSRRVEIVPFASDDGGATWSQGATVSPPGALEFNRTHAIESAPPTYPVMFAEWHPHTFPPTLRIFAGGPTGLLQAQHAPPMHRVISTDAYSVSAASTRIGFPNENYAVFIASGETPYDALAAVPAAAVLNAPVLLARRDSLPAPVAREIRRLQPSSIVIVGGANAIGAKTVAAIRAAAPRAGMRRIAGRDRYATAAILARWTRPRAPLAIIASGETPIDALTCGPLAVRLRAPILLAQRGCIPGYTSSALRAIGATSTIVVGGTAVIPDRVMRRLPSPGRIAGADRYRTSVAVATYGLTRSLSPMRVVVASGLRSPDPLSASVLAWRYNAPVLLADLAVSGPATSYLYARRSGYYEIALVGDARRLGSTMQARIRNSIRP